MTTHYQTSRRQFLGGMAAGSAGLLLSSGNRATGEQSPNERPVFATIGLRNQGWAITKKSTKFASFAALADVDANVLEATVKKVQSRQGKKPDSYKDYRKVLDKQMKALHAPELPPKNKDDEAAVAEAQEHGFLSGADAEVAGYDCGRLAFQTRAL